MDKKKAVILLLIAGLLWGTSGIFVHYLSPLGFSSIQMTAVRATVSSVFITLFMVFKNRASFRVGLPELWVFISLAATLFFACFLYYTSITRTSVCTAVILLNVYPVYVTVFSTFLFGERMTWLKASFIGAIVVGCCFISGVVGGLTFDAVGIVLGLLSGVSYAAYVLLVKFYNRKGIPSSSANLYSFFFMAVIALSVCEPVSLVKITAQNLMPALPLLIGLGICTFVIPFVLNSKALKVLPAGTASALCVMEPFSATMYSVLFFDERLDAAKIVGIVLILGAVVMLGLSETGERETAEQGRRFRTHAKKDNLTKV